MPENLNRQSASHDQPPDPAAARAAAREARRLLAIARWPLLTLIGLVAGVMGTPVLLVSALRHRVFLAGFPVLMFILTVGTLAWFFLRPLQRQEGGRHLPLLLIVGLVGIFSATALYEGLTATDPLVSYLIVCLAIMCLPIVLWHSLRRLPLMKPQVVALALDRLGLRREIGTAVVIAATTLGGGLVFAVAYVSVFVGGRWGDILDVSALGLVALGAAGVLLRQFLVTRLWEYAYGVAAVLLMSGLLRVVGLAILPTTRQEWSMTVLFALVAVSIVLTPIGISFHLRWRRWVRSLPPDNSSTGAQEAKP